MTPKPTVAIGVTQNVLTVLRASKGLSSSKLLRAVNKFCKKRYINILRQCGFVKSGGKPGHPGKWTCITKKK